ncbi:hypothetical protein CAEBREN_13003 [Caenorhabditis brenneri]|uniref:Protein kinase domain-containing protein n=1 Tax=Caenorhabditis brenneri TaxID=135651 RepID=G0P4F3_CAEBE|nr:hypothetical protein CAEBREN_13003 [Caenorhabditis brenneri]
MLGDYALKKRIRKGTYGKIFHKDNTIKYAIKLFNKNAVLAKNQIKGLKKEFMEGWT